uniref:Uncharacterized protein n=1 Tax=Chrysotila carterae TaxID=13221 RepID=A0A7S4C122_CHRCT|eukprot:2387751-Pleurochrysis_carterae.AAC.1
MAATQSAGAGGAPKEEKALAQTEQNSTPESPLAGLGLPSWLEELMAPGVGQGVFVTLKLSLVALIVCLLGLLYVIKDPEIRIHLYVFLAMSAVLMVLVIWFVGELQTAKAAKKGAKAE